MIGSFSISCPDFFTALILTTWEIPLEYRLITCLPKAFPVFLPFSFSSRYLYSAYVLLMASLFYQLLQVSIICSHRLDFLCLLHRLNILVSYATRHLLLVYQKYFQRTHHRPLCFLNLALSVLHFDNTIR